MTLTATTTPPVQAPAKRKLRNRVIGMVTSDKVSKTRKGSSSNTCPVINFAKYNKYAAARPSQLHACMTRRMRSHFGDQVEVMSCRPISKTKTWRLVRIVVKGTPAIDTSILEGEASEVV